MKMQNDRHMQASQLCGDGNGAEVERRANSLALSRCSTVTEGNWSSFGRRMVLPFLND